MSEGSYLITMDVRLPVFGKALILKGRDKKSILNKGHLLNQDAQKYTSQRVDLVNNSHMDPLSMMDAFSDQAASSANVAGTKNVVYNKTNQHQQLQQ